MTVTASLADATEALEASLTGRLLRPGDGGYEEARRIQNGLVDKRPAVIVQCRGTADVVDAVRVARQAGLEIAVRGGGHNVAGRSVCDGGLVIDLSPMKGVHVDPAGRTATAEGGVLWKEFNRETQVHGLATTGGVVGTTGVAGLTLGGGVGFLMGKHGLTVDNLLSVELVTADGDVLTASADRNADLFWGLRGGGGNFGVATRFTYRLHPVGPTVVGGLIAHPFSAARELLQLHRELTPTLPDELTVFSGFVHAPDGSGAKMAAFVLCHCGDPDEAEAAIRPMKAFGEPVMDAVGPVPYTDLNAMLDTAWPKGALNYWKSSFMSSPTDEAIDAMVRAFDRCPPSMSALLLEGIHGAVTRVGSADTAFAHRDPGFNCGIYGQWLDHNKSDVLTGWVRETYAELSPHLGAGKYVNYLGDDEGRDAVAAAYGPNYRRLRELKAKYDPENVFHLNQNILPA